MRTRWLLVACALLPACSFAFVEGPDEAMLTKKAPVTCTTSRLLPLADLLIGVALGTLVFSTTYAAVEEFNEDLEDGQRYRPWGPGLIGAFLVSSPSLISSAVGFSDTHQCRKAHARATP